MKKINFGKIERVILFGGGQVILETAKMLQKKNIELFIFLSKSQSLDKNNFEKKIYSKILIKRKIKFKILKSLKEKKKWHPYLTKKTLGISNTCRWIFDKKDILLFNKKLVNIHNSELPSFAGGGGKSWNLMMNFNFSGVTFHLIDENIDTGKIILQKSCKFSRKIFNSLDKINKFSVNFEKQQVKKFFLKIFNQKDFIFKKNRLYLNKNSSYWPRLNSNIDSWVDWNWKANQINHFVKSFCEPYGGAKTFFEKKEINIKTIKLAKSQFNFHPYQNGIIYKIYKKNVFVACNNGGIILNKKDFNKKSKLLGKRLHTPYKKLEQAFKIKHIK